MTISPEIATILKRVGTICVCVLGVFVFLSVLSGIGVHYKKDSVSIRVEATSIQIKNVLESAQYYYADCNKWPASCSDFESWVSVCGSTNGAGPYNEVRNHDPCGNEFVFRTNSNVLYVISMGYDGKLDTADDVVGCIKPGVKGVILPMRKRWVIW